MAISQNHYSLEPTSTKPVSINIKARKICNGCNGTSFGDHNIIIYNNNNSYYYCQLMLFMFQ